MFKNVKKIPIKNSQKGIALVIAINVVTLLLSLSLSISNIVLKQIKIVNVNNASKPTFFAADSAMECAFFHDTREVDVDNTGDDDNSYFSKAIFGQSTIEVTNNNVSCGAGPILGLTKTNTNPSTVVSTFDVDYGNMCASVEVVKTETNTNITARGFNTNALPTGCNLADADKRRLVERGLTITY